jgi:hypothetical protein
MASDLDSLYVHALDLCGKEAQKLKKKKRARYDWMLAQITASSASPTLKRSENTADPNIVKQFAALLVEAGFDLVPPQRKHSIGELTADLSLEMPSDLISLYSTCDGGECRNLNLRIVPLQEAIDLAMTYQGMYPVMGYFPFVKEINGDYRFLCTTGPLEGYVLWLHHDDLHEFKARSLRGFLEVLANNRNSAGWWLEDGTYGAEGRPRGHVAFEMAGKSRTTSDVMAAQALLKLAEQRVDAEDGADEYAHLFDLALTLLPDEQSEHIVPLLKHRNHEVRQVAQFRLAGVETPDVIAARREAAQELAAFVAQAVEFLRQNGLDAHAVNGTDIRIDPGPVWLNMPGFFDRRNQPDVWDYLLERAKTFVSLQTR